MTPSGIEPVTFRFVARYLKHCATAVPIINMYVPYITSTCGSVVREFGHCTQQNKTDMINQRGVHQGEEGEHPPV
jgi:hypothetical protein